MADLPCARVSSGDSSAILEPASWSSGWLPARCWCRRAARRPRLRSSRPRSPRRWSAARSSWTARHFDPTTGDIWIAEYFRHRLGRLRRIW